MLCPLCNQELIDRWDQEYFHCGKCKGWLRDRDLYLSPTEEKAFYLTHQNDVNDQRYQQFTAPVSDYIMEHFQPHHRGLDFGSGTGPVISKVLADHQYQVNQYDPFFAPATDSLHQNYDYIIACEVIEHFQQPRQEFRRLHDLLNPGGALVVMTLLYHQSLDFAHWRYRRDPTHVIIYQPETIRFIQRTFKFSSVQIKSDRLIVWKH